MARPMADRAMNPLGYSQPKAEDALEQKLREMMSELNHARHLLTTAESHINNFQRGLEDLIRSRSAAKSL